MSLHPAASDLLALVRFGLERGAGLANDVERALVDAVEALEPDPALLLARLWARPAGVFREDDLRAAGVDDLPGAFDALACAGLASAEVPWPARAAQAQRAVLAAGCRRLGLDPTGRRAALVARLEAEEGWDEARWWQLPSRPGLRRLARWATLRIHPDPSLPVLERLGAVRWPSYVLTGGSIAPSRAAWDTWEAVAEGWDALDVPTALDGLAQLHWAPRRLDLRPALVDWLLDAGRALERGGAHTDAVALYRQVLAASPPEPVPVALRLARALEAAGAPGEALEVLAAARPGASDAERVGLGRTGRRLARRLGQAWAPDLLGPAPTRRTLRLLAQPDARWGPEALRVEGAVARQLRESGREVLRGEGRLWRQLAALLLGEVLLLPVPGQLPVPRLSGPLDAWTPRFAARRREAIDALLAKIDAGEAPARVREVGARFDGVRLTGLASGRASVDAVARWCEAVGPRGLRAVLDPLLRHGRRALRGLPDLVVLPGPAVRVSGLFPRALPSEALMIEVKAPGDALRDAQEVWLRRLNAAGLRAELWEVVPDAAAAPTDGSGG